MYIRDLVMGLTSSRLVPRALRPRLWTLVGHSVSSSAVVNAGCFVGGWRGLSVGEATFISYGCFFDLSAPVRIGTGCEISVQARFITSSHVIGGPGHRAGDKWKRSISVGDGAWIGAGVTRCMREYQHARCVISSPWDVCPS